MSKKMTTNEPTTGEIVRALRNCFERSNVNGICMKCEFTGTNGKYAIDADECGYGCEINLVKYAITRLESQERAIADKDAKIAEQTARAEQAEKERDAAKADMKLIVDVVRETYCDETCCFACKHDGEYNSECPGFYRDDCFEWRGLPQDGEGK